VVQAASLEHSLWKARLYSSVMGKQQRAPEDFQQPLQVNLKSHPEIAASRSINTLESSLAHCQESGSSALRAQQKNQSDEAVEHLRQMENYSQRLAQHLAELHSEVGQ